MYRLLSSAFNFNFILFGTYAQAHTHYTHTHKHTWTHLCTLSKLNLNSIVSLGIIANSSLTILYTCYQYILHICLHYILCLFCFSAYYKQMQPNAISTVSICIYTYTYKSNFIITNERKMRKKKFYFF